MAEAFAKLSVISEFRAMANAESLYPTFIDFISLLFQPLLEIDPALVRRIVLSVVKLGDCFYCRFRQWKNAGLNGPGSGELTLSAA